MDEQGVRFPKEAIFEDRLNFLCRKPDNDDPIVIFASATWKLSHMFTRDRYTMSKFSTRCQREEHSFKTVVCLFIIMFVYHFSSRLVVSMINHTLEMKTFSHILYVNVNDNFQLKTVRLVKHEW